MTPLAQYALSGLSHFYQPEENGWCYGYQLDERQQPRLSRPEKDCFYSLNIILGLAACGESAWQGQYNLPQLLHHQAANLKSLPVPTYALGMALWAAAWLEEPLKPEALESIYSVIGNPKRWHRFTAQDAGMILSGLAAQKTYGNQGSDELAHILFGLIKTHFFCKSGLFRNNARGLRKNFASFAAQAYLIAACYHYGYSYQLVEAFAIADRASRVMIGLQGAQGQWPWFYYAPDAAIIDSYEIYSVHQYGMAPLFLIPAKERGVTGAAEALTRGFDWVIEQNMLAPEYGMFYRSHARPGELHSKHGRLLRTLAYLLSRKSMDSPARTPAIRKECRSYELGWLLYAFGNRMDMPEITHHAIFMAPLKEAG